MVEEKLDKLKVGNTIGFIERRRNEVIKIQCSVPFLIKLIEGLYNVPDFTKKTRKREVIMARFSAMFALKSCGFMWTSISEAFSMHHSTIMHSVQSVIDMTDAVNNGYGSDYDREMSIKARWVARSFKNYQNK